MIYYEMFNKKYFLNDNIFETIKNWFHRQDFQISAKNYDKMIPKSLIALHIAVTCQFMSEGEGFHKLYVSASLSKFSNVDHLIHVIWLNNEVSAIQEQSRHITIYIIL